MQYQIRCIFGNCEKHEALAEECDELRPEAAQEHELGKHHVAEDAAKERAKRFISTIYPKHPARTVASPLFIWKVAILAFMASCAKQHAKYWKTITTTPMSLQTST